jgi:hypothetical protein
MKAEILAKLAEVAEMLMEATCDGEQLAELDCYSDVADKLAALEDAVDYYVD